MRLIDLRATHCTFALALALAAMPDSPVAAQDFWPDPEIEIKLAVRAKDGGAPLAGVRVTVRATQDPRTQAQVAADLTLQRTVKLPSVAPTAVTNERGEATLRVPKANLDFVSIQVEHPDYVAQGVYYRALIANPTRLPTSAVTFELAPGVSIGGTVRNEVGEPVVGAAVTVHCFSERRSEDAPAPAVSVIQTVLTDADGRWAYHNVVADAAHHLSTSVRHPDYDTRVRAKHKSPSVDEMLAHTGVHVLVQDDRPKVDISGIVLDARGKPIEGAEVLAGSEHPDAFAKTVAFHNSVITQTGPDGRFTLTGVPPGVEELPPAGAAVTDIILTAHAAGHSPQTVRMPFAETIADQKFSLQRGNKLSLRVVDSSLRPIANAVVGATRWNNLSVLAFRALTDSDGRITWDSAPIDPVVMHIWHPDYRYESRRHRIVAGQDEQTAVLYRLLKITGSIYAGESSNRVTTPASVQAFSGSESEFIQWHDRLRQDTTDGRYQLTMDWRYAPMALEARAEGYDPQRYSIPDAAEGEITVDFHLPPLGLKDEYRGRVLSADGQPAPGAVIYVWSGAPDVRIRYEDNSPSARELAQAREAANVMELVSGENGQFLFRTARPIRVVSAATTVGFAEAVLEPDARSCTLMLQPYARLEGAYEREGKPAPNAPIAVITYPHGAPFGIFHRYALRTDEHGRFSREGLVGPVVGVGPRMGEDSDYSWYRAFSQLARLTPGATTTMKLGGSGRTVVAAFRLPDGRASAELTPDCVCWLSSKPPFPRPDAANLPAAGWAETPHDHSALISADLTVRFMNVPPGEYSLYGSLSERLTDLGSVNVNSILVPVADPSRPFEPFDLGLIDVKPDP